MATDVIAEQLGVSSQALLKRFESKRDLMLAALRPPAVPPWTVLLQDGPDARSLNEQLTEIALELVDYFADITRRLSLIRWSNIPIEDLVQQYPEPPPLVGIRALSEWLQRAHVVGLIRKTDFRVAALSFLGSLHCPAFLEDLLHQHPTGHAREEYVAEVVQLFVRGLEPAERPQVTRIAEIE